MAGVVGNLVDNVIHIPNMNDGILVRNPATGAVLATVPKSTSEEILHVAQSSVEAFKSWSQTSRRERQDKLHILASLIHLHEAEIVTSITAETGKTNSDARSEVHRGIDMIQTAAALAYQVGERAEMSAPMQIYTSRYPLGVCVAITPFNLPFLVPLWTIPFAISLGNVMILKPSELAPTPAMWIGRLIIEAGFPPGVLNIAHGNGSTAQELVTHDAIKTVSFVGSELAGREIYYQCSGSGRRIQANLSAMNSVVVLADSPKEFCISAIVQSTFAAAGQRCTSPKITILVGQAKEWLPDIAAAAKKIVIGEGSDPLTQMGPIVTSQAKYRIIKRIEEAISEGARIVLDGREYSHNIYTDGNWLAPTILSGIKPRMGCFQREIFGPVMLCMEADSLEEAIEFVNFNKYGNGCSVFTSNGASGRQFQRDVNVGMVSVNNPHNAPQANFSFSSNKASFLGETNFYGKDCLNFFTYTKTLTSLWHHPDQRSRS